MTAFIFRTIIVAVGLLVIAGASGGAIQIQGYLPALLAALLLGVANAIVKPVLFTAAKTVTCALSCLTLGLWSLLLSWFINALLFWVVGNNLDGFRVNSLAAALWGSLALSLVNAVATALTSKDDKK